MCVWTSALNFFLFEYSNVLPPDFQRKTPNILRFRIFLSAWNLAHFHPPIILVIARYSGFKIILFSAQLMSAHRKVKANRCYVRTRSSAGGSGAWDPLPEVPRPPYQGQRELPHRCVTARVAVWCRRLASFRFCKFGVLCIVDIRRECRLLLLEQIFEALTWCVRRI